ncbi:hypothetical protein ACHAXA_000437 [Cyclostephanos tholiformis]|uniref:Sulfotransferase domain-containing protein n=1 Tax=Cyclostephanos tholiformis TaxID=382380 RepID=A0ABD3RVW8_9STRA
MWQNNLSLGFLIGLSFSFGFGLPSFLKNLVLFKECNMPTYNGPVIDDTPQLWIASTGAVAGDASQEGVVLSRSGLIFPNVLLVGSQKAGTTAVAFWLLSLHATCGGRTFDNEPGYFKKEVHFFDHEERFRLGKEFYARRFEQCNSSDFVIDATPKYAHHAIRIADFYRQYGGLLSLKVMMILREPISRELSAYNHKKANSVNLAYMSKTNNHVGRKFLLKKNYTSFDEYVDEELVLDLTTNSRNAHSLYSTHLRQWFDVLQRDQIMILSYHELITDPVTFQRRVEGFLGLSPERGEYSLKSKKNEKSFPGKEVIPSCLTQKKLADIFQLPNKDLYALLAQKPGPPMEQKPFPEFEVMPCYD